MDKTLKTGQLAFLALGFFGLLYLFKGILAPFIIALILAYALNPLVERMTTWHISRSMASGIIVLLFLSAFGLLILSIAPKIQTEVISFIKRAPELARHLKKVAIPTLDHFSELFSPGDMEKIKDLVSGYFGQAILFLASMITGILSNGLALANTIALLIITPVVCFYTLKDWDDILASASRFIPPNHTKNVTAITQDIDQTMAAFARGQAMVCFIMAIFYSVGLSVVKLDFALIIGIATGILTCLPYVGMLIGITAALIVALTQFTTSLEVVQVFLVFAVGIGVEGYFLTPKLVGDRIGVHPIWIIFSVLAGAKLLGIMGAIIALPLASIIGVLLRHGIAKYHKSALFMK